MSVFGTVFGRKGVVGFSGSVLGACSGVVGFNVAMFLRAVRGICRPARPDVGASAKKFTLRAHNGQKLAFDGALGKYFRGNAAGAAALGKYFRGSAVVGSRRASLLCRVPGSRAPLLAVLTRSCAAKPYWWHGRQPAQATTYRASVRRKRPRPPPHGLTCASKGPACAGCVHRNRRGPDGSQASRRSPCLLGYDGGGTPKDPASRCARSPRRRCRKVTLPTTRSVL